MTAYARVNAASLFANGSPLVFYNAKFIIKQDCVIFWLLLNNITSSMPERRLSVAGHRKVFNYFKTMNAIIKKMIGSKQVNLKMTTDGFM